MTHPTLHAPPAPGSQQTTSTTSLSIKVTLSPLPTSRQPPCRALSEALWAWAPSCPFLFCVQRFPAEQRSPGDTWEVSHMGWDRGGESVIPEALPVLPREAASCPLVSDTGRSSKAPCGAEGEAARPGTPRLLRVHTKLKLRKDP